MGDWDNGHYKAECGWNEYVSGVSMTPSNKKIHAIRCAAASLPNGGHNNCETRRLSIGGDDRGTTSTGEWDHGHYKAECSNGKVAYGVSVDTANGTPSRMLCCDH
jgi:hypothetical protein